MIYEALSFLQREGMIDADGDVEYPRTMIRLARHRREQESQAGERPNKAIDGD